MNRFLIPVFLALFLLTTSTTSGQNLQTNTNLDKVKQSQIFDKNYQLSPTQNQWTFIKLDTRNGKMWQVQWGFSEKDRMESTLNGVSLVLESEESVGRFKLYNTNNMWNFILLDQLMGQTYQVQWSFTPSERFVKPIF
jgi:hypothetical protein